MKTRRLVTVFALISLLHLPTAKADPTDGEVPAPGTPAFVARDALPANVLNARLELSQQSRGRGPVISVYRARVAVQYGNSCVAGSVESYVADRKYSDRGLDVKLFGAAEPRICPMVFRPVVREVLIEDIDETTARAGVSVNGVRARAAE